jgi:aquaglyceroporin related protein
MASNVTQATSGAVKEHTGAWPNMETSETETFQKEHPQGWSPTLNHQSPQIDHSQSPDSKPERHPTERTSSHLHKTRGILGLHPTAPIDETHDLAPHQDLLWSRIRLALREPFAEFLGVFVLVMFGNGSVAQVLLSQGETTAPGGNGFGAYQSISWGWGLGTMLGIYVAGDSGAYLNPAITFASCYYRGLPWRRFPMYFLAQFLGGFVASAVVYANYVNAINEFEGHGLRTVPPAPTATAGIFCTYPQSFMTKASQFFSEFIASSMLMLCIFALKDDTNVGVSMVRFFAEFLSFGVTDENRVEVIGFPLRCFS